jgi:hypothetical protein
MGPAPAFDLDALEFRDSLYAAIQDAKGIKGCPKAQDHFVVSPPGLGRVQGVAANTPRRFATRSV